MTSQMLNREPIPGYRLIERLGRGGYGEVWKAEAPGGLLKAIKFVYGDLEEGFGDAGQAEQELKALHRVKTIRHPYILSLERFDIVEGQLLIVMELADRTLWDRYEELRRNREPGVPRDELLHYMEECAEALDLMNLEYSIQHLDIKPQNLFLVHNHVKVADFGLAKDFDGLRGTLTGGVTPVYAAPETFEREISRQCDQYSLAIVWQEMLTGVRPFSGTTMKQLLHQHLSVAPDLSPLPIGDRPIIGRALSKRPEQRYATCNDMVRALRLSDRIERPPLAEQSVPTGPMRTPAPGSMLPPKSLPILAAIPALTPPPVLRRPSGLKGLPALITPGNRDSGTSSADGVAVRTPGRSAVTPLRAASFSGIKPLARTQSTAPPEKTGSGILYPVLLIGVGRLGGKVVGDFSRQIVRQWTLGSLPNIRRLLIDTDPDSLRESLRADNPARLTSAEVLRTALNRPAHYLRREGAPPIETWMKPELLYRMPRGQETGGIRALGRLALTDHYRAIGAKIRASLEEFADEDCLRDADNTTGLGYRTNQPTVYLVSSTGGGTGSGMLVDLAYLARQEMLSLGYAKPSVSALLLLPHADRSSAVSLSLANSFATLSEIHHYSRRDTRYEFRWDAKQPAVSDANPPFAGCSVVTLPRSGTPEDLAAATDRAASLLRIELLTPLGRVVDEYRQRWHDANRPDNAVVRNCGSFRIRWPIDDVMRQTCARLTRDVIARWTAGESADLKARVDAFVVEQLDRRQLEPTALSGVLEDAAARDLSLGATFWIDATLSKLLQPEATANRFEILEICETVDALIQAFGKPGREEDDYPGRLRKVVLNAARSQAAELESRLVELTIHCIDEPAFRIAGAALSIARLSVRYQELQTRFEYEADRADRDSADLLATILPKIAGWDRLRTARKPVPVAEFAESVRQYARRRWARLLALGQAAICRAILGHLPELRREVGLCRLRLEEQVEKMLPAFAVDSASHGSGSGEKLLLPDGCATISEAAKRMMERFTAADLTALDESLQGSMRRQCEGLSPVCLNPLEHSDKFRELFQTEIRRFVEPRLSMMTAAQAFVEHRLDPQAAQIELTTAYGESVPDIALPRNLRSGEYFVLGTPSGGEGETIRTMMRDAIPEANAAFATSIGDIIFVREHPGIPISKLPQMGMIARQSADHCRDRDNTPVHSRHDVAWTEVSPDG